MQLSLRPAQRCSHKYVKGSTMCRCSPADQPWSQHRQFFNLPLDEKVKASHSGGEAPARGYSPWAYEKTAVLRPDLHGATRPCTELLDAREQFAVGPPHDALFPTPQPASTLLPDFVTTTRMAYQEMRATCMQLVAAVSQGLGVPPNAISGPAAGGKGAELNLNFYPKVERQLLQQGGTMRRIWPHTDLGVVSALLQDGVGQSGLELQVRGADEAGRAFAPVDMEEEGDLVLFVGDTLERWTNGRLRAAVHRVGVPRHPLRQPDPAADYVPERRSAVMFYRAPPAANLGPSPYFVDARNPARYEAVTASEYLKRHNRRLY
jgi:isopenicillin N synthase-like dioxygenase